MLEVQVFATDSRGRRHRAGAIRVENREQAAALEQAINPIRGLYPETVALVHIVGYGTMRIHPTFLQDAIDALQAAKEELR